VARWPRSGRDRRRGQRGVAFGAPSEGIVTSCTFRDPPGSEIRRHELGVVSVRFYSALNDLDVSQLSDVWSQSSSVTTMHPMGGQQVGWPDVRRWFEEAAGAVTDERVEIEQQVTNIYRREGGQWKMVPDHADVSTAIADMLRRRQAA
jgi:hypothetical protein